MIAVVAAIYLTLGLARTLAGILRGTGILEMTFFLCFILVIATVIVFGLRARPRGLEIGIFLAVLIVYVLIFVRMSIPEERTHLIEYGVVGVLIYEALKERSKNGRAVPVPVLLAIGITTIVGVIDESIQAVLPSRVFDPRDILFNFLAGMMAIASSAALGWARHRGRRDRNEGIDT